VEVVFAPMPYLGCSCGAERRVAYADFLADLRPMINELVPHAEAPRFGKTLRCGSCDEAVTRESATARTFDVDLALERTIPFHMKLTAPDGKALFAGPHLLLPADKVRHVGEAVHGHTVRA